MGPGEQLWGSGANDEGQLALQNAPSMHLPMRVPSLPGLPVRFAVAAGDHSIAVVEEPGLQNGGLQRRTSGASPPPLSIYIFSWGAILYCYICLYGTWKSIYMCRLTYLVRRTGQDLVIIVVWYLEGANSANCVAFTEQSHSFRKLQYTWTMQQAGSAHHALDRPQAHEHCQSDVPGAEKGLMGLQYLCLTNAKQPLCLTGIVRGGNRALQELHDDAADAA